MAVKSIWAQGAANGTLAASMAKRRQAFTPWAPNASPPAGTYDPGLDAQSGAIDRGQLYSTQDLETAGSRAEQDYGVQQHQLTTGRDQSLADLLTGHTRAGEDYSTSSTRLGENHATNLESIGRNYQRLGVSQAGAANQRGVATEGSHVGGGVPGAAGEPGDRHGGGAAVVRPRHAGLEHGAHA
jgi:hypothetical protein